MKKTIILLILLAAFIYGCAQQAEQQPSQEQPSQPKVTTPVEEIAADELAKEIPEEQGNGSELNDLLVNSVG